MSEKPVNILVKIRSIIKDVSENNISSIPNCNGAYVIKVESGKLYVGSSKTLCSRISEHKGKLDPNISTNDKIVSTCYYQTNTLAEARVMEYWLIREINPELNKTNKSDKLGCGEKCSKKCETWSTGDKSIEFNVNIIETCEDIPEENLSNLPKKCGVYVITTKSGKQYVGSATNVCSRVKEHHSLKGGNVKEPIKSVSCFITENRNDAYILEYFNIRELKPELNREFRDDAWEWKEDKLVKHFKKRPNLEELFKEFDMCVISRCLDIEKTVRPGWITYGKLGSKNIFFLKFMKDHLRIDLRDPNNKINDNTGISIEIKPTQEWTVHRRIELFDISEIDKAMSIIVQAYKSLMIKKIKT